MGRTWWSLMPESRFVLGLAYQAGFDERLQPGLDGMVDYFSPAELEKAAWSFLDEDGQQVGLFHVDGTTGAARVVESYIYRGPDWDINGTIVHAGDWLLGVICDETAWQLVKSGRITGFSPQGRAKRRPANRSNA